MSRVYFHSPSGVAELHGSERAWLRHLARGPADAAWDLRSHALERAEQILAMVPEVPDGPHGANYLHNDLRAAQEQHRRNVVVYKQWKPGIGLPGHTDHEPERRLLTALRTRLRVDGVTLNVAGVELRSDNVEMNTALVAGSDPIKLAAKIDGWCESHAWVEGPDRAWLADIIEQGLTSGMYRRGLWYSDDPNGPKDKWSVQGWEDVQAHLRARDDEPVVLSYSAADSFPNQTVADWQPVVDPQWMPDWADGDGFNEWSEMGADEQDEARRQHARDQWYELPDERRWELAMAGLRRSRAWARLGPGTLTEVTFHLPVTVYDLFAPDRDERVRAAARLASEPADA